MRIRAPRDFLSGIVFVAIGGAFAIIAGRYPLGSALEMGPGYAPRILGWVLALLGAILLVRSFFADGPPLAFAALRPLGVITLSIVLFGFVYGRLGLVAAIIVSVLTACLASSESKLVESIVIAVLLALLTTLLFVSFLQMPLRVWPDF